MFFYRYMFTTIHNDDQVTIRQGIDVAHNEVVDPNGPKNMS